MRIEDIENPSFLKNMKRQELEVLASDIRKFLIENISKTGGHLASNLGIVELTIALHYVFDSPYDKLIFDVGHQSYVHKILTGRAKDFSTLRQYGGMSGYIKRNESPHDCYEAGHSSTSISALSGFLKAKEQGAPIGEVVAIIGDASLTGGLAFEGLNYLGSLKEQNPIVVINDNKMGISKSVGAMSKFLNKVRGTGFMLKIKKFTYKIMPNCIINLYRKIARGIKGFIQNDNIFEDLGFQYMGPVDGNDINSVIKILKKAKSVHNPCVVHVITQKGLGYHNALYDSHGDYHGVPPFDILTGEPIKKSLPDMHSWSEIISEGIIKLEESKKINVLIPAMINGSKFEKFQTLYPDLLIDVGIAEEHAAVMATSMALSGAKVFYPVYSTFAQRAYDEFIHDVARHDTNVVIGIDRAGIVGEDGDTHQGIYDIAYLSHIPNMIISMPHNPEEAFSLLKYAFEQKHPVVIRYPRGSQTCDFTKDIVFKKIEPVWEVLKEGKKAIVISYGPNLNEIISILDSNNLDVMVVNARFIKPIDTKMIDYLVSLDLPILVYEEVVRMGGLNALILDYLNTKNNNKHIEVMAIDDIFVPHGDIPSIKKSLGIDMDSFIKKVREIINEA